MRRAALVLLCLFGVGCDSPTSPSSDVTDTWSGVVGQPQSGSALRIIWVAGQTGSSVAGPATLFKPATNVPATGPLSGTLNGNRITWGYLVPSGSVPGFPGRTISGNGSATVSDSSISGTLALTFTACSGSALEPTAIRSRFRDSKPHPPHPPHLP